MCLAAARFQVGTMPAGSLGARLTWPRSARLHLGAWLVMIGAKKISPMPRGAVPAQYLGGAPKVEGWKMIFYSSTSGVGGEPRTFQCRLPRKEGPMCCSLVSNTNGPKTLLGNRMHHEGLGSLFVALIWASGIFWRPMRGSSGWRWRGYVYVLGTYMYILGYSCYFPPNDRFEIFKTQILLFEEIFRKDSGHSLIAADFNSKSPVWSCLKDRRLVCPQGNNLEWPPVHWV